MIAHQQKNAQWHDKPSKTLRNQTSQPLFPWKLHELLDNAERYSAHSDIVSWVKDDNAFKIHKPNDFCETMMKTYFKQSKFKSFTRQLYIYGFSKIVSGPNAGAYYHPRFVRHNRKACLLMGRNKSEDRRCKQMKNEKHAPRTALLPSSSEVNTTALQYPLLVPIECDSRSNEIKNDGSESLLERILSERHVGSADYEDHRTTKGFDGLFPFTHYPNPMSSVEATNEILSWDLEPRSIEEMVRSFVSTGLQN